MLITWLSIKKEIYKIKNAIHVQTYYVKEVVNEAVDKWDIFYKEDFK